MVSFSLVPYGNNPSTSCFLTEDKHSHTLGHYFVVFKNEQTTPLNKLKNMVSKTLPAAKYPTCHTLLHHQWEFPKLIVCATMYIFMQTTLLFPSYRVILHIWTTSYFYSSEIIPLHPFPRLH